VYFDLEECFTLLEQHEKDAERREDCADSYGLRVIKGQLTALLAGLLDEISANHPPGEGAAIVTFNYDTLLEQAVIAESAYRRTPWDPVPAYAAPFDVFERRDGEPSLADFRSFRFPLQAHAAPFLKLHGSLNWFRYTGGPPNPASGVRKRHERLGQTLVRPVGSTGVRPKVGNTFMMTDGTLLEKLVVTPVLNKDVDREPFSHIWRRAKEEMRRCERLVIGGYSFPPSDFATRRLFLESFVGGPPDELVVINPDTSVVQRVKNLCHFERPVSVCASLAEYLA
jgi:hypothetical protein